MLAFNDTFWLLACFTAGLIPLTLLFRNTTEVTILHDGAHSH